jgi:hypothetical protein
MGKPRSTFGLLRAMFLNPKAMIGVGMMGLTAMYCVSPLSGENGPVTPWGAARRGDWVPAILLAALGMGGLAFVWFAARRFGGIYLNPRRVTARVTHVTGFSVRGLQDITYAYEVDGRLFKKRVSLRMGQVMVGQSIEVIVDSKRPASCVLRNDPYGSSILVDD